MKYKGNIIFISIILIIAVAVTFSYYWNIKAAQEKTDDIVKEQSNAFFSEIVTTRQWNAGHGGVYVPVTDEIQPNKYLDVPDRDVYTTDSMLLTKINPAFMTRLISEIAAEKEGIHYHITSLNLTNPNNKADDWETQALKSFEKGEKESFEYFKNDSTFRYMAPLMVTNTCMKCHEKDGYEVGDVRGGISVTTPSEKLIKALAEQKQAILIAHALIFLIFLLFIILLWFLNYKQFKKIQKNNELLKTQRKELELQQKATEELNQEIFAKSLESEQAKAELEKYNKELQKQQEETEKLNQEIFAKSLEAEQARQELENSTEKIRMQSALADILSNDSGLERNLNEFLSNTLDVLFNYKWLNTTNKAAVLLVDENGNLKIEAEKGLEDEYNDLLIKPNEGLCGKALAEKTIYIFNNNTNSDEDLIIDNKKECGHAVVPIIFEKEVLGMLNIFTKKDYELTEFEINLLTEVANALSAEIHRNEQQKIIQKTQEELEKRNKAIRMYTVKIEQQVSEKENLNQMILAQKKQVEQKNKEVQKQKEEVEKYAKTLEKQAKEQEKINQQLFAQKLEVEQRNLEIQQYADQIDNYSQEQEALNQKLFAQKMEVEQRNTEAKQYIKQIENQKAEQEKINQQLFAQKLEVDQRRFEIEQYSKEVEKLKEKSEYALKHLSDSINYSKYIQDSLLPTDENIKELIPGEHFIYYNPKETIGGDFYYVNEVKDHLIIAVADCTGHGVPGALITMLGITFIDDIVEKNLVNYTGEALGILRDRIKKTFKSYGNNIQNKNGLDISICAINLKTNVMQYSGAFSPMFIYRNSELIEYKATRNPIGYYPVEKEFETVEIQLQKNDVIYLFSDGYPDQIGGEKERKFSKRQFKELLFEIHKYPMNKQSIFVEKIMQKWMGNLQQVDDITLMGIKWENEAVNKPITKAETEFDIEIE